ncbi:Uncharacterised protein [Mycobacteroides abscessus subsp. abscessus]|nr:Uncharacterised protein [Mycobacteroides abscessus subsp. abscessus]
MPIHSPSSRIEASSSRKQNTPITIDSTPLRKYSTRMPAVLVAPKAAMSCRTPDTTR